MQAKKILCNDQVKQITVYFRYTLFYPCKIDSCSPRKYTININPWFKRAFSWKLMPGQKVAKSQSSQNVERLLKAEKRGTSGAKIHVVRGEISARLARDTNYVES